VFRSAVDTWAIDQVFPMMPIHRLCEEPTVAATLADITCDSDGKLNKASRCSRNQQRPCLSVCLSVHACPTAEARCNKASLDGQAQVRETPVSGVTE
jgi:hypothetical protein